MKQMSQRIKQNLKEHASDETVRLINLHPIFIQDCQAVPENREQSEYIVKQMTRLCKEMGTEVEQKEESAWIPVR